MTTRGQVPIPEPGWVENFDALREFHNQLREWVNWIHESILFGPIPGSPIYLQGTFTGTLTGTTVLLMFVAPVSMEMNFASVAIVGEGGTFQYRINGSTAILGTVLTVADDSSAVYKEDGDFDEVLLNAGDEVEVSCETTSASTASVVQITLGGRPTNVVNQA
jgi:hypothetical protein